MRLKHILGALLIGLTLGTAHARAQDNVLRVGATTRGEIRSDSRRLPREYPHMPGRAFELYRLEIQNAGRYSIDMRSAGEDGLPDPYLILIDRQNNVLAHDDDSGGGLDARIRAVQLAPGTYYVVASTFTADTGTFDLHVTRARADGEARPPAGPGPPLLGVNGGEEGTGVGSGRNAGNNGNGPDNTNRSNDILLPGTTWTGQESVHGRWTPLTFEFQRGNQVRMRDGEHTYEGTYEHHGNVVKITIPNANHTIYEGHIEATDSGKKLLGQARERNGHTFEFRVNLSVPSSGSGRTTSGNQPAPGLIPLPSGPIPLPSNPSLPMGPIPLPTGPTRLPSNPTLPSGPIPLPSNPSLPSGPIPLPSNPSLPSGPIPLATPPNRPMGPIPTPSGPVPLPGPRNDQAMRPHSVNPGLKARPDLAVTITWDTKSDVDLWVSEPGGAVCSYRTPRTTNGGTLHEDNTTGFGPEHYTIPHAPQGEYVISVHHYRAAGPTTVQIEVTRYAGTAHETVDRFTARLQSAGQRVEVCRIRY